VNTAQLRAVQAPLKERYRDDPGAALITLSAAGELGEGVSCSVQTGRAIAQAGLHPASGVDVPSGRVRAEGDLDFRGTLGVDRDAPVGFRAIRLSFELDTDATEEELATLQRLTERYCVVYQTLATGPQLSATLTVT
jgi:uncharacterized OsmC-like protein